MRQEYELQTYGLATIVAATAVTPKHAALLTTFATRTDYRGARYAVSQDSETRDGNPLLNRTTKT
ncbi:TPA: hypothetical protein ACU9T0_006123 [Burkholderia cenocepacia]|uniref:hypothetical protein n=1 Tax=Burkholderia cenocepacia TaxID=95486 RepID=UPI002AB7C991|nr:hypothetical protein [Burkholderia cenocepacia]